MMKNTNIDAGSAKLAGLQIDLLQKIRNGQRTIEDIEWFNLLSAKDLSKLRGVEVKSDSVAETPYLRLISGGKNPKISACAGGPRASLAFAGKTFPAHLDNDFKNWKLDTVQPETAEAEAEVWEMHSKDGMFNDIFNSINADLQKLKWNSQEQIEKFCIENKSWLRTDGYGTFFLFEEEIDGKKEFFVANVYFGDVGRLKLSVRRLSNGNVWNSGLQHRFVVPATWRLFPKN